MKPNAALALPTFFLLLLWRRSSRARALAGALGGAATLSAPSCSRTVMFSDELWQSVVVYHRNARDTPAVVDRSHELAIFLNWRTPFAWLVLAGLVASILLLRRARTGLGALVVGRDLIRLRAYHQPLHHNHLAALSVALAAPAAVGLAEAARRVRPEAVAVVVLALLSPAAMCSSTGASGSPTYRAAGACCGRRHAPPRHRTDDIVVSDQPLVPFLADRRVWGPLVDTANLRFQTGSLTAG